MAASILFAIIILLAIHECFGGKDEKRLLKKLLSKYDPLVRPVSNESDPVVVSFGLALQQIIDVDEKNQILTTNAWLNFEWTDTNLTWVPEQYGNVKNIRIPPNKIWKPDVLLYNSAHEEFDNTFKTNILVRSNGSCNYIPPGIFKSTCKIDITWFPFDDQKCVMKFGSWTYDGYMLDLVSKSETGDISGFTTNGEWDLIGVPSNRTVQHYSCCPEPYVDITFIIHIRRRTLYYFFNLIVPSVLISSMALLGFTLPPDSGERLTLGVTILLSLTVFLNLVAETLPQVSDAIPLLGTYFNCIMFMVASSVVLTVVVLDYHHRRADMHEMPNWVRTIFLLWLPWILRMSRPNKKVTLKTIVMNNRMKELELKERSSRSLLANVLDMDDDYRSTSGNSFTLPRFPSSTSYHHSHQHGDRHSNMITSNVTSSGFGSRPIGFTIDEDNSSSTPCLQAQRDLQAIIRELRFITSQIKKREDESEIVTDWKFAAMVVDRVCLIVFTLFTVIATITVLLSASHIIVP